MKSVKARCMFRWVGALLARTGRCVLQWTKALWANIYYKSSLRTKILIPVFLVTLLVIGVLSWFAFVTLHSTLTSIYEQRARSVAAVVSKSIQEKEYILYYSDELDADIEKLLKRYESVVSITIVGMTGRGLLIVASTDPTTVGLLVSEDEQERFSLLRETEVSRVSRGEKDYLRAYHPLLMGSDLVGVVSLDMSLEEEQRYLSTLSWQLGLGSLVGFLVLGTLLYAILHVVVTRPVFRLDRAAQAISQRDYDVEVSTGPARKPGTRIRDEVARFIEVFNLMVKVIQSREQALSDMVILDESTGAYNLSHFQQTADQELKKGQRYKHPTSVLLVGVSGVEVLEKADQEKILIATTNFLTSKLRAVDPVFRVSENRFVVLFPETPAAGAQIAADRLREQSADLTSAFPFSVSLHIVSTGWDPEETPKIEDVLHQVQAPLDQG